MRLFVAIPVPGMGKPEAPAHLTLRFLGEVEPRLAPPLEAALSAALRGVPSFSLEVRGVGAFPNETRPRIVWAGIAEGRSAVVELARRVGEALLPFGFPAETTPFVPHLTLLCVRGAKDAARARQLLAEGREREFARLEVDLVELVESVLSPSGARHARIAAFPLGPASPRGPAHEGPPA